MPHPEKWRRLGPGVYIDDDFAMHIIDAELLRANGYADTPANRRTLREAAEEFGRRHGCSIAEAAPVAIIREEQP